MNSKIEVNSNTWIEVKRVLREEGVRCREILEAPECDERTADRMRGKLMLISYLIDLPNTVDLTDSYEPSIISSYTVPL